MANSRSAAKRARQGESRRLHNMALRSRMRTAVKKVHRALKQGDAEQARSLFGTAVPEIDTMVTKGIIHRNKAARHKSRINRAIRALDAD